VEQLRHTGKKGKLNKSIAITIRELYATGNYTQVGLAKKYGVARGSIKDILAYRSYK
jgi:DNA-binding XRE family transcriptional regulator